VSELLLVDMLMDNVPRIAIGVDSLRLCGTLCFHDASGVDSVWASGTLSMTYMWSMENKDKGQFSNARCNAGEFDRSDQISQCSALA
jgi:hypothetical protein